MTAVDNEKLCALAQNGNMDALNSLVENNLRFIKMTAHEIWSAQIEVNRALGVTFDDLVQEGCLGLMGCVEKFNPDGGNKFLTYAAPAIRNSMIDYIRSQSTSFEAKHMGEIVSLDEVTKFENRDRHAFVPDSNMTNPAQIYIAKETHEELHAALDAISNREREYLLYRFGFEDNIEHPLTETAEHFFLSESRAKSTERLALDMVIRDVLDRFLDELPAETRKIFVRRYFYMSPVKEIADEYGLSESKVTVTLFRTRGKLKSVLEKEGITL